MNTEERVNKACIAFYACSKTFGKKWGLQSKMILWTYTAVVRPILTYGSIVWWPALNKAYNINKLKKVQRTASIGITGALRTCSTDALNVILNLLPLDQHIKYLVSCSSIRLKDACCWTERPYGHSNLSTILPSALIPHQTDYCNPTLRICKSFKVGFPTRTDWENEDVTRGFDITIFTDGSKMECGVDAGVFSETLKVSNSYRLPDFASVFQAEVLAVREACKLLYQNSHLNRNIAILIDSQAAIKAINSTTTSSKLVRQCQDELNGLGSNLNVTLLWVPGHSGIHGNEQADELARQGSALHGSTAELVNIPLGAVKGVVLSHFISESNRRWGNLTNCIISRKMWPAHNESRTNELLCKKRSDISRIVAICTGHWPIGVHAARLGIPYNDHCRSCEDETERETVVHFLCQCPALAGIRLRSFGKAFYEDLGELSSKKIKDLLAFLDATKWLQHKSPIPTIHRFRKSSLLDIEIWGW